MTILYFKLYRLKSINKPFSLKNYQIENLLKFLNKQNK